jgi:hypothetical protein
MTIYSKTMAGRMVAFDQQTGLTPVLKGFLKSVDGKTPTDQLLAQWQEGPDALQLLKELERQGLIELRAVRWSNSSANSSLPPSLVNSPPPALTLVHGAKKAARTDSLAGLDPIKEEMATFLLTHLPQHEIEEIDSYDRLMMMLTAYANVANEAGREGLTHIKSLRSLLEPGFERTAT